MAESITSSIDTAFGDLLSRLSSPDPSIRLAALHSVTAEIARDPQVSEILRRMAHTEADPKLRRAAWRALEHDDSPGAGTSLQPNRKSTGFALGFAANNHQHPCMS